MSQIRVNYVIDKDQFPEIYEEELRLRKNKKRVDGTRLFYLATLGLLVTRGTMNNPLPKTNEIVEPSPLPYNEPKPVLIEVAEEPTSIQPLIDQAELDQLDDIMGGKF